MFAIQKLLISTVQRVVRDNRGVAFIEFAFTVPFLIIFFIGSVDVTQMILIHQKLDKAAATVGDLTTQLTQESDVCSVIQGWQTDVVKDILKPFTFEGPYTIVVSSVLGTTPLGDPNPNNIQPMIEWRFHKLKPSVIGPFTAPYVNRANLPPSIADIKAGERIIVTEMKYKYKPFILNFGITGHEFTTVSYMRARMVGGSAKNQGALSGC